MGCCLCLGRREGEGEVVVASGRPERNKNGQLEGENSPMTMVESNVHNHYHERNDGEEIHL